MTPLGIFREYESVEKRLLKSFQNTFRQLHSRNQKVRLVALLLARQESTLAKTISSNRDYLHIRSGLHIDFFWVGWDRRVIDAPRCSQTPSWAFIQEEFVKWVSLLERTTKWTYSGATDLLLLNAHFTASPPVVRLDYDKVIALQLDELVAAKAINSVDQLFEDIIRFATAYCGDDPASAFSNRQVAPNVFAAIRDYLFGLLPKAVGERALALSEFAIKDVSIE